MKTKIVLLFILFSVITNASKITNSTSYSIKNKIVTDTIKTDYQKQLQGVVDLYLKLKIFSFKDEILNERDVLENKDFAVTFAKNLIYYKHPELKNMSYDFAISEDNSKKLWFVNLYAPTLMNGTTYYLIIVKSNCKILFYGNICCPKYSEPKHKKRRKKK